MGRAGVRGQEQGGWQGETHLPASKCPAGWAWGHTAPPPLPQPRSGDTHLQDEDSDKGDGEDDHHLDELVVRHPLLAGEVILQQIRGPRQSLGPRWGKDEPALLHTASRSLLRPWLILEGPWEAVLLTTRPTRQGRRPREQMQLQAAQVALTRLCPHPPAGGGQALP